MTRPTQLINRSQFFVINVISADHELENTYMYNHTPTVPLAWDLPC